VENFQVESISRPLAGSGERVHLALHLLIRAQTMGYLPPGVEGGIALDLELLDRIGANIAAAGIATSTVPLLRQRGQRLERALRAIVDAVDASPNPAGEWPAARDVLGEELLARLLDISESSLRRYASGERTTPDGVATRLHAIARILAGLLGSYNEYGVRLWFDRPLVQLGGESPASVIHAAKTAEELEPPVQLALSLTG
jgi:hypothetical protein